MANNNMHIIYYINFNNIVSYAIIKNSFDYITNFVFFCFFYFFLILLGYRRRRNYHLPEDNPHPSSDSRTRRNTFWAVVLSRFRESVLCEDYSVSSCVLE